MLKKYYPGFDASGIRPRHGLSGLAGRGNRNRPMSECRNVGRSSGSPARRLPRCAHRRACVILVGANPAQHSWTKPQTQDSTMPTTEHTINDALAAALRKTRHAWQDSDVVKSEQTRMIKGHDTRPDILVVEPNVSPVAIEVEVLPAITVEAEAVSRLGEHMRGTGRTILSSIAVRLPERIRAKQGNALLERTRER